MLSRSIGMPSRKDGPPSIWDTHGISENVFANAAASSSAPYPQEVNPWSSHISEEIHSSQAEKHHQEQGHERHQTSQEIKQLVPVPSGRAVAKYTEGCPGRKEDGRCRVADRADRASHVGGADGADDAQCKYHAVEGTANHVVEGTANHACRTNSKLISSGRCQSMGQSKRQ